MSARQESDNAAELFRFEGKAWARGCTRVAGVDEVGRGPLAGPVVAAAVILPRTGFSLPVNDSKALTPARRAELAAALLADPAVRIGIARVDAECIDRLNILRATHKAMREALDALPEPADFVLVDGLAFEGLPIPAQFLVKGDARSASIAAASIVAKVHRDRIMCEYDIRFPGYGFARHKGYGTAEHLAALRELGVSAIHRRSFAPVRRILHPGAAQLEFSFPAPESPPATAAVRPDAKTNL